MLMLMMLMLMMMVVMKMFLLLGVFGDSEVCRSWGRGPAVPLLSRPGDLTLGGAFSIHTAVSTPMLAFTEVPEPLTCSRINLREFRFVQTMIFAIEEINNSSSLLPGVSLGFKIFDSCDSTLPAARAAMGLMDGQQRILGKNCSGRASVHAIVGASSSSSTIVMLQISGIFHIPMISHFATCACLSNTVDFPSFFRTIPTDLHQSRALAKLVKHFGWSWVGAVRSDNDYGNNGMEAFIAAAGRHGVCIEYSEAIARTDPRRKVSTVVRTIARGTAKVVVAFLSHPEMEILAEEALSQNLTGLQWVGNESWITAGHLATRRYSGILTGALGFTLRSTRIQGLREFLLKVNPSQGNDLVREFWETVFGCSFQSGPVRCSGSESLQDVANQFTDVSELRISYNVYKAVYAAANALHQALSCNAKTQTCSGKDDLEPKQVVQHLRTVNFTMASGERVEFDEHGDPSASYQLVNWQTDTDGDVAFVAVGSYDASLPDGEQFIMNGINTTWASGSTEKPRSLCSESCRPGFRQAVIKGKPICCFVCVRCAAGEISNASNSAECSPCPLEFWSNADRSRCLPKVAEFLSFGETMGFVLTSFSLLGAVLTLASSFVFFRFRRTPLVKANNSELSFLLLFSLALCFLCSLAFIGRPSGWSCAFRHTAFGVAFALCVSCVLAKTVTVVAAFKARRPSSAALQCSAALQRAGVVSCTGLQAATCAVWLALAPPFPDATHDGQRMVLVCRLGSEAGFWAVLGYIGFLALLCLALAFLARKLPDNFNEAKFITFSMLIFCAVWIAFIPAYVSSPGKFTVAVEIFAILASSYGMLICIFFPKLYVILLKPENNTRKHLMGKDTPRTL